MMANGLQTSLERLYGRRRFGIELGLEVEEAMLSRLGNPHSSYRVVHVAGTNGKGTVSAIIGSVLGTAGYRVGLYTSPHMVRFNERLQVGGDQVADTDLMDLVRTVEDVASEVAAGSGRDATFFECATAMAFEHFRRQNVDVAVVETGLGGRLDATNTVTPLVSVITRIAIEHTQYLGDDLPAIAAEKAGIVKPGVPVVAGMMPPAALDVIRGVCAAKGCLLVEAGQNASVRINRVGPEGQKIHIETAAVSYGTVRFPLLGKHQVENLATAVTVVDVLRGVAGLAVDEGPVGRGIASVRWPGRFQVVETDPPVVLDGAHNPDAARALADTLAEVFAGRPVALIVGMCGDKDAVRFLGHFSGVARRLWVAGIAGERNMPADTILAAGRSAGLECVTATLPDALNAARDWARDEQGVVCLTGSLFLVGEALETSNP